jgi:hypothetical protein
MSALDAEVMMVSQDLPIHQPCPPKILVHFVELKTDIVSLHFLLHNDAHHEGGVACTDANHPDRPMLSDGGEVASCSAAHSLAIMLSVVGWDNSHHAHPIILDTWGH